MISQNTLIAQVKADLYSLGIADFFGFLLGENAVGDIPVRLYYYNGSSSATDDGENVIQPTAVTGAGRWLKQLYQQKNSDWTQGSSAALDYIVNKPSFATVATSGVYNDLIGRPSLVTVATTGIYSDLTGRPSIPTAAQAYEGNTQRVNAFPIFFSGTVGSGIVTFQLTTNGLAAGPAIFPTGVIQDSVNAFVSDPTASYQMGFVFSNSNKTLTVTANKLTTSNLLTGILGQAQANTAIVRLQVWGY